MKKLFKRLLLALMVALPAMAQSAYYYVPGPSGPMKMRAVDLGNGVYAPTFGFGIAAPGALVYKGATDCSANPNYPAANAGDLYLVSVAGKIGGASGTSVVPFDAYACTVDATLAGNEATVGANWSHVSLGSNAVMGPASVTDSRVALFDGTTGKLLKQNTVAVSGTTGTVNLVLSNSPTLVTPTLGVASATSLATSAASPLLLTNGQLVTVALTSQTVAGTTLTIPDFASVADEFTFKTKAQTMSNKTFVAPVLGAATGTSLSLSGSQDTTTANGASWVRGSASELLTLSTLGATTDTTANLLPANAVIEAVVARVTTTITTATDWKLGDATTPGRFTAANVTLTAGTTDIGLVHVDQTGAAGPRQTSAAKVRVTTTGTPGAGVIRITVFYRQFVAPTS